MLVLSKASKPHMNELVTVIERRCKQQQQQQQSAAADSSSTGGQQIRPVYFEDVSIDECGAATASAAGTVTPPGTGAAAARRDLQAAGPRAGGPSNAQQRLPAGARAGGAGAACGGSGAAQVYSGYQAAAVGFRAPWRVEQCWQSREPAQPPGAARGCRWIVPLCFELSIARGGPRAPRHAPQ